MCLTKWNRMDSETHFIQVRRLNFLQKPKSSDNMRCQYLRAVAENANSKSQKREAQVFFLQRQDSTQIRSFQLEPAYLFFAS